MKIKKQTTIQTISGYICDRCGLEASVEDFEAAEFTSIELVGGYGSTFGDGARVTADICQHCLKDTLGEWLTVSDGV